MMTIFGVSTLDEPSVQLQRQPQFEPVTTMVTGANREVCSRPPDYVWYRKLIRRFQWYFGEKLG